MSKIHVNCHPIVGAKRSNLRYMHDARFQVKQCVDILEKFATEDGFDEYCEWDTIGITVGTDCIDTCFSPRTWDAAEYALMFIACHFIVSYELDKFPYYDELLGQYSHRLGLDVSAFDE